MPISLYFDYATSCSQPPMATVQYHVIESAIFTYCPQVKFAQGAKDMKETVLNMDEDLNVSKLRNETGADLVQMIGNFADPSRIGYG